MDTMIDKIRKFRLNITFGGVLVLLLGVVLVLWPVEVTLTFARIIGLMVLFIGVIQIVGKLFSDDYRTSGLVVGVIIALIGGYIIARPMRFASIIPIIAGVMLVAHGMQQMGLAFAARKAEMRRWWLLMLLGVLDILFGIYCVAMAFHVITFVTMFLGFVLIYDGVVAIISANRVNYYERQQIIDAQYWEIKDDQEP